MKPINPYMKNGSLGFPVEEGICGGEFTYSRAGHLPPIFIDSAGGAVNTGMSLDQPIGLFDDVQIATFR